MEFIVHLFRNIQSTLILFDREALASASLNTRYHSKLGSYCSGYSRMWLRCKLWQSEVRQNPLNDSSSLWYSTNLKIEASASVYTKCLLLALLVACPAGLLWWTSQWEGWEVQSINSSWSGAYSCKAPILPIVYSLLLLATSRVLTTCGEFLHFFQTRVDTAYITKICYRVIVPIIVQLT